MSSSKREAEEQLGKSFHDAITTMQAAWIEANHGDGPAAAMQWITGYLLGPGLIPGQFSSDPHERDPQAWWDAYRSDPFPTCKCGRPSNILSEGSGYCSDKCYQESKR